MELTDHSLRRQANMQGGALLIYWGIMNLAVFCVIFAVAFVHAMAAVVSGLFDSVTGSEDAAEYLLQAMSEAMAEAMGWGYLLTVGIGFLILLLWKKPVFFLQLWRQKGETMTVGRFSAFLTLVLGGQIVGQLATILVQWLLEMLGVPASEVLGELSVDTNTVPMFLYACILGPIAEELLFRGLLQGGLTPYSKRLALVASSILFGLFHGNPIQAPYAFVVGLVLGYVAMEYHIFWSMLLHVCNNLLFGDVLPRLLSLLPLALGDWIHWALILAAFVASVAIVAANFPRLQTWLSENPAQTGQARAFYGAATVVIFLILSFVNFAAFLLLPLFSV